MQGRTNRIGRHLPTSGGLAKTLEAARAQGCETVQLFVSNPQGWADPLRRPEAAAEEFVRGSRRLGLAPVVVHAKYLINLASRDEALRERSARSLALELVAAGALGAQLVVVHAGSHGGSGEAEGMARLAEGLVRARELAARLGGASVAQPVLENSVGAGTQLCSDLISLGEVARRAGVRVCLDTAHAFVAGYDLSVPGEARRLREELGGSVGREAVAVVHLNDARNGFGSHRDGHCKIGEGRIPRPFWRELFAALPGVPAIMETPYGGREADAEEVRRVKALTSGLPVAPGGV